jgi:hypothetical protein
MFPLAPLMAIFHDEGCRNQDKWHQNGDDRDKKWIHQNLSSGPGPNGSSSVETRMGGGPAGAGSTGFFAFDERMSTPRPTVLIHGNVMAHLEPGEFARN